MKSNSQIGEVTRLAITIKMKAGRLEIKQNTTAFEDTQHYIYKQKAENSRVEKVKPCNHYQKNFFSM